MRSDDGPVPMNVGTHDARTTQSDQNASNHMTYDDVVRSREKDTKLAKEQARRDQTEHKRGTEEKDLMNGRVSEEQTEERKETIKAPRGSKSGWYGDKNKGPNGNNGKGKDKGKGKSGARHCYDCGEQWHIGVGCPSSWESDLAEEKPEITCECGGA